MKQTALLISLLSIPSFLASANITQLSPENARCSHDVHTALYEKKIEQAQQSSPVPLMTITKEDLIYALNAAQATRQSQWESKKQQLDIFVITVPFGLTGASINQYSKGNVELAVAQGILATVCFAIGIYHYKKLKNEKLVHETYFTNARQVILERKS